jgi:hypothetical protein
LAPDKVKVFVPALARALAPLTTPLKEMSPALPPTELALANATVLLTETAVTLELIKAPAPPMPVPLSVNAFVLVKVWPFKSSAAALLTVIALAEVPNAVALPACNVPPLTMVPPE